MTLILTGCLLGVLLVTRAYVPEAGEISLEHLLIAAAIYLVLEGVTRVLASRTAKEAFRKTVAEKESIHGDLTEAKRELEQLSSIFREVKEREISLEEALKQANADLLHAKESQASSQSASLELLTLLSLLQQKGRFIDFLSQEISSYSDEHVGKVARFVHEGCSSVLKDIASLSPVFTGTEGEAISLESGYDPAAYRLSGNVPENPPYRGKVLHKGWRVEKISLPKSIANDDSAPEASAAAVLAPAEVEVA